MSGHSEVVNPVARLAILQLMLGGLTDQQRAQSACTRISVPRASAAPRQTAGLPSLAPLVYSRAGGTSLYRNSPRADHPERLARDPLLHPGIALDGAAQPRERIDRALELGHRASLRRGLRVLERDQVEGAVLTALQREGAAPPRTRRAASQRPGLTRRRGRGPGSGRARRAPRRCGAAGCTSRYGRCGSRCRS